MSQYTEIYLDDEEIDRLHEIASNMISKYAQGINRDMKLQDRQSCTTGDEALTCEIFGVSRINTTEVGNALKQEVSPLAECFTETDTLDPRITHYYVTIPVRIIEEVNYAAPPSYDMHGHIIQGQRRAQRLPPPQQTPGRPSDAWAVFLIMIELGLAGGLYYMFHYYK